MRLWLRMSVDTQVVRALAILDIDHDVFTDATGRVFYFDGRRHTLTEAAAALLEGGHDESVGRPGPRIRTDRRTHQVATAA